MAVKATKFDWRVLQRFVSPQAANDLNNFLEKLPGRAGHTVLIASGIVWGAAGALGLYTAVQTQQYVAMRAELMETQALEPTVPSIRDVPVNPAEISSFAETMSGIYPNLKIESQGGAIKISAANTSFFGQFREAVGHVQNGGSGWRVNVSNMCVGRECSGRGKLEATLRINKVSVDNPN